MSKLLTALRNIPKRPTAVVAVIAAAVLVPAALFAWGPDRPTYTMAHPADHPTFDSITDNPNYGDEREFMTVKDLTTGGTLTSTAKMVAGHEYQFQIYIHNNAASELNASGKAIAKDVTVRAQLPASVNGSDTADAFISSSNATPKQVWDSASITSTSNVGLQYVSGSAMLHTNSQQAKLSDNLITTGVKVGDSDLSGTWHGCLQYAGAVTFKVKATGTPNFTVSKEVSKHGANQWVENYTAKPGETVDYLVEYKNTGSVQQDNVVLKDQLPAGMTYVTGSSVLGNALHPAGIKTNDGITASGINIGSYGPGGNAWVIFSATVPAESKLACGTNTLHNVATAQTANGSKSDAADVNVSKECKPEVAYTCDALTVSKIDRTHFKFATTYSSKNATFKSVKYTVRSGNTVITDNADANYTQEKAGDYTVQAYVTFTVDGQDKTVTSDSCKKPFTVTPPNMVQVCNPETGKVITVDEKDQNKYKPVGDKACQPVEECKPGVPVGDEKCTEECKPGIPMGDEKCNETCVPTEENNNCGTPKTPETPTELPHTGASDNIIALVGAGSLIAAIGYYIASRRALIS
jgi:uncharacterized repeat protein (TIGR01451 family)/LPXTG-motif cell wall-anchored protein